MRDAQTGFTYLGLLFAVAMLSAGVATTGEVWHTAQQRQKEQELLFIGNEFRQAIRLYYVNTPSAIKRYPPALEDLLKDPRYPNTQRYLRKLYRDPMTGQAEWGLVESPGGGIAGIHSLSDAAPLKSGNFSNADLELKSKTSYSEWTFIYQPKQEPKLQQPAVSLPPLQKGNQTKFSKEKS